MQAIFCLHWRYDFSKTPSRQRAAENVCVATLALATRQACTLPWLAILFFCDIVSCRITFAHMRMATLCNYAIFAAG